MVFEIKIYLMYMLMLPDVHPLKFPSILHTLKFESIFQKIRDFISDVPQLLTSEVKIPPIHLVRISYHGCTFISCRSTIRDFRLGSSSKTYATTSAHCSSSRLVSNCREIPPSSRRGSRHSRPHSCRDDHGRGVKLLYRHDQASDHQLPLGPVSPEPPEKRILPQVDSPSHSRTCFLELG